MLSAARLPSLPPPPPASAPPRSQGPQHSTRPKRRLSNATQLSIDDDDDALLLFDDDDEPKGRGKRSRPHPGAQVNAGSPKQQQQPVKALTEKEKEQRRIARMIRNRNAAQASRDRKKEHTAYLERRVADLEAQLRAQGGGSAPSRSTASSLSAQSTSASASKLARSHREASVTSSVGSSEHGSSQGRIADLEDENEALRSQLHLEQAESAQLRTRLDALEHKLVQLSAHVHPGGGDSATGPSPFFTSSGTSTPPFPAFQPTFAFDTPNLSPLPQPEERAYLEERERERTRHRISAASSALELHLGSSSSSASSSASTSSTSPPPSQNPDSNQHPTMTSKTTDSSRLVAREVESSLQRKLSPSRPSRPVPSYLELEPVGIDAVWTQWAEGSLPPTESAGGKAKADGDEESALAFIDLSFLQDGPAAQC
ncbi:hypothetical protein JCM10207_001206 [Rhodosporidiobolus poonsookiae]